MKHANVHLTLLHSFSVEEDNSNNTAPFWILVSPGGSRTSTKTIGRRMVFANAKDIFKYLEALLYPMRHSGDQTHL